MRNISTNLTLRNLKNIKTWWSYDFGLSTIEYTDAIGTKTRSHMNKINCYVRFEADNGFTYIYEQIHLSEKFPNNHEHLPNENLDQSRMIRVWDVDKCLQKLQLTVGER